MARIEKYIDEEGRVQEAFSYGESDKTLIIWYSLDAYKAAHQYWIEPNPRRPPFENTKKFNRRLRIEDPEEEDSTRQDQAKRIESKRKSF